MMPYWPANVPLLTVIEPVPGVGPFGLPSWMHAAIWESSFS